MYHTLFWLKLWHITRIINSGAHEILWAVIGEVSIGTLGGFFIRM